MKKILNRNICLFAHYDPQGIIDDYVVFYLRSLRPLFKKIIFVSTAKLLDYQSSKLDGLVDLFLLRENLGYDFSSWKMGLSKIDLDEYDELLICNDSCYGPFFDLKPIFNEMNNRPIDFWGITHSNQIDFHIQSYFMVFKKNILRDNRFKQFWLNIENQKTKMHYVFEYEVGLSKQLIAWGYKCDSVFSMKICFSDHFKINFLRLKGIFNAIIPQIWLFIKIILVHFGAKKFMRPELAKKISPWGPLFGASNLNYSHSLWDTCLKRMLPFLKVELLRDDPLKTGATVNKLSLILKKRSKFDVSIISKHLERLKI